MSASALTTITRRHFPTLDSTNAEAKRLVLASDAPLHGTAIVADEQSHGRGRYGREWQSQRGNLFYSLILQPNLPHDAVQGLVFVAGLAVADAIEGAKLKWPNDVLLHGKKVAGILLETVQRGNNPPAVIIGIGINIASHPEKALYPATSLAAEGMKTDVTEIETRLEKSLPARYEAWRKEGLSAICDAWRKAGPERGERIRFSTGEAAIEGSFDGLAEDGALLLTMDAGHTQRFWIGDVTGD